MADDGAAEQPPDFQQIGRDIGLGIEATGFLLKNFEMAQAVVENVVTTILAFLLKNVAKFIAYLARLLMKSENSSEQAFAELAAIGIEDLFGVRVNVRNNGITGGKRLGPNEARSIGEAVLKTLTNTSGTTAGSTPEPSMKGAEAYLSNVVEMVIEGWLEDAIVTSASAGYLAKFGELDDLIYETLGFGRLSRRVLSPLVDATVVKPAEWQINKTYSPNLLSEGEIIKAFQRGDYTGEEAAEELARLGYTPRRRDMLVKSAAKRLSVDDIQVLRRVNALDRDYALQNLRDEGYDDVTANFLVTAAEERRYQGIRDDSLSTIMRAFADREIDEGQLRTLMDGVVDDDVERDLHVNTAQRARALNIKHMTQGEVIECVELGVLAIPDYRRWLEREGYAPDDADALELRLRVKLKKAADADAAKKQQAAERAKAQADAAAARQKRLDELEAQRALHARGSIADLRRAAARGLIPLDRLAEVLQAEYDADTVQILMELAEQDRADYVAQQQRADEARKRAAQRNIDLGSLEQGVLHHIITVDAYRDAVADRGFSPADVQILTATLAAKLQDQDAAAAKRAKAEQDAKIKHIDLGRFERLVRRGIRSLDQYRALLGSFGYDEASIAAMVALLQADIADDAEAQQLRDAARSKSTAGDLTLEQMRRAVLLGLKTDADFQAYLVRQKYTSDAQAVLVAELRRDVADAESARQQRQTSEAAGDTVDLPLSRITAAARLGIITPDAYAERLQALGYSDDDIAIEMELLLQEIANVQAARAKAAQPPAPTAPRGLSLADLERAVRNGTATIDDYRARAVALGFSADDADTLTATLQAELATLQDAQSRRVTIDGELAARTLSLGQLEDAVKAGAITLDAYEQQLEAWGYGADDAQLLAALLADSLAKKAGG
jgi:hypothetical protein